ncbi:30S ribosomal protein S4 [Syntrophobacter fumaroxidans]|uniref:Small ribosomal subunit protein uS4 n=1 Tax=Syntrophobacter fumaroxidans (strain DSM 10017 / MPOB) TaxID=335543 RepID=RS4_SYNFM|nr:30S ribosomal protein S4 [Syntrophobacter fumaroxidans]A0LIL6.1 RecName: Full=Small ribosomal subunit protein uS4; AltName: Full=30S ribosomal protein S4 [Syntrophobacter fumaroxidans MPOB]ABK17268.1 SSU ribosomal protein S4P [Syntrophobacter fumaroxidans MPOB]HOI93633.1 30S ribosomal protein S4 [Syntrophobacter fumaroxidans]
MARYTDSSCRICRRETMKLYLKGDRCYSDKCAVERRNYPPGQHGQGRGKFSDYGLQLREKQKIRRMYGLVEKQFKTYFKHADRQKGVTGTNFLTLLERRIDNTVYRLGFASSRAQARQLVRHSHFLVNGKKVNIPSFLLRPGDSVSVVEGSRQLQMINEAMEAMPRRGLPPWLELDKAKYEGVFKTLPTREEMNLPVQEQLVVEFYSK